MIKIPYEPLLTQQQVNEELGKFDEIPEHNIDHAKYITLYEILEMHKNGQAGKEAFELNQTLLRVGPVVFVPFPFEVFTEITMRLRAFAPFQHTLSISCANGSNGYLPDESQMCRGGYEVDVFRWLTPERLPEDTDSRLIAENLKIMEEL